MGPLDGEDVEPAAAGNSRHASQLTDYENTNIIIAGHARFRRLCLSWSLAENMTISQAIRKAERVLPGKAAPEGELDTRWQAIIGIADHIEHHPDEVWSFTRKWGAHACADLRAAVATCLLEHLLEYHFDRVFPLVSEACRRSVRFGDTLTRCAEFGQTSRPRNLKRFRALKMGLSAQSPNKTVQRTGASRSAHRTKRTSPAAGSRR